ncbi:MAG TPA: helix-turn-helix domain-containing protein, partial [Leptospiraceae bacterium]|nr:helix-turn-helix domain-containing protein [Leptospiraceae bacterium]
VMFEFARMIASTTLQFRERLRALTLLNVQQRLESFLSELGARKQAVALPLPKNQIASLIGSTPESVSRAFRILVDEGKLKVDGERYHLEGSGGSKADAASV